MIDNIIKVFISYSWDNEQHQKWVKKFADDLDAYKEVHIVLDQYDLSSFDDKNHFMEQAVYDSQIILIVCTEEYANKANNRKGGVGIETKMTIARHWDEMEKTGKSDVIAILRGDKTKSIPYYLKDKIYISFEEEKNYANSLSELIDKIKSKINSESKRPTKTKSLTDKQISDFQFDRVDDILAINYRNRDLIKRQVDYSGKNEIKYEYWKVTYLTNSSLILILFNNVNIKDTIERFIANHKTNIPNKIIILRANKGRSGYIQSIFDQNNVAVTITEYTIEKFVWEECIDQDWKKENKIVEDEFFIDQRVYKNIDEQDSLCGFSLDYLKNEFLTKEGSASILMLFASGGMGKSTLSQVLINRINMQHDRKALLIQSEIIRNNIQNDAIKNFSIKNLYQLYDIYIKMISDQKSLLTQKQFELGVLTGRIVVLIDGLDEIISLFRSNFNLDEFIESLIELNKQLGEVKIIITSRLNIFQNNVGLHNNNEIDLIFLQGFEEDIWKQYVEKRFAKYSNTNMYLKKVEKYLSSVLEPSQSKRKVILPFFLE